ncbi:MAG: Zn-dependent hydrolase [bacterium]
MTRRLILLVCALTALPASASSQTPGARRDAEGRPHVSPQRLERTLQTLGTIGRDPETGGITRLPFSPADLEARSWFADQLRAAGLEVRTDPAGNLIGRLPGTGPALPPIVLGSHLDTVPQGGRFDGALGLVAALEAVRSLADLDIRLRHPVEVVDFIDEEGGLVGSRAWIGTLTGEDMERPYGDRTYAEALRELGLDPERVGEARRTPDEVAAYVELHPEQGRRLERGGKTIGVVEGIVALDEYEVEVVGEANHAGTTRMVDRRDPLTAAARMVTELREEILSQGGDLVATVGLLEALPGTPNVIPGRVRFTVDIRDPSPLVLDRALSGLRQRFRRIAREEGVEVSWSPIVTLPPAPADPMVREAIREAAEMYGYPFEVMPSGAGHDAQSVAGIAPMGMIFVPSVGGFSHSPSEFTTPADAAAGADVLLQTVLLLDGRIR